MRTRAFGSTLIRRASPIMAVLLLAFPAAGTAPVPVIAAPGPPSWYWQNPVPQGHGFFDLTCPQATYCLATGPIAGPLRTTDAGATWSQVLTPAPMSTVTCPSPSVCVAGGDQNSLLKTNDSGQTWISLPSPLHPQAPATVRFLASSCPTLTTCFAVGSAYNPYNLGFGSGVIIATNDGGSTWVDRTPGQIYPPAAVSCPSVSVCFATGHFGSILRTTDGGLSWVITTPGGDLGQVSCVSVSNCFIAGPGSSVLRTTNEGGNWTVLPTSLPQGSPLRGMACSSSTLCIAGGDDWTNTAITLTADGGSTWRTTFRQPAGGGITRITCPTLSNCVAVGNVGVILTSADGGQSWSPSSTSVTQASLNGISCPIPTVCVAVGDGGTVARTSAGGSIWSVANSGTPRNLAWVSCSTTTSCVAVGEQGTVLTTGDSGQTWTARVSGSSGFLLGVSCTGPSVCIAVGDAILRSADGGKTWSVAMPPSGATLWYAASCFGATCVAVSSDGSIASSADAGTTWLTNKWVSSRLSGVSCPDANVCLAVGQAGILRSSDGGKTWTVPSPPTPAFHLAIACATTTACAIVDGGGIVLTTSDGGNTVTSQQIDNWDILQSVTCPATDACVISGLYGAILSMRPAVSPARSTVTVAPAIVANDGISAAVVTVTLRDPLGYPVSGRAVGLTQQSGPTAVITPATTTSDARGQTTFHVSGTVAGTAVFSVTDTTDGVTFGQTASATIVANPYTATSRAQYHLADSDGTSWADVDPTNVSIALTPTVDSWAIITGNTDLWTATSGVNQDIAISVDGAIVGWKESGGYAGTFSPNAAAVQAAVQLKAGITHLVKLQWKTNTPAPGATIFAGAGPWPATIPSFSPTVLTVRLVPISDGTVQTAMTNQQYQLVGSNGATWQDLDGTGAFGVTVTPSVDSTAIVSGNVDLWTATAGYNQDIGINLAEADPNTYPGNIVAWKESGGYAGTFSPNAAFVQSVLPLTHGVQYHFKLQWKTNRSAPGATIYAGAGPWPAVGGAYSPNRLTVQLVPATSSPKTAVSVSQFTLNNNDGNTWADLTDSTGTPLSLTFTPTTSCTTLISGNVDLWTATTGVNQDIGIYVSPSSSPGNVVAWKESGGYAGTFSPNAAYVQTTIGLTGGTAYTIKLVWKANKGAAGSTIFAGAGPWPATGTAFSPTRLLVQSVTCS